MKREDEGQRTKDDSLFIAEAQSTQRVLEVEKALTQYAIRNTPHVSRLCQAKKTPRNRSGESSLPRDRGRVYRVVLHSG